ncbi:MAG TPA: ABC transporter ATP-binding protein [Balneolaceae bacterium]|nr:ABC transporter ATP-binding protein [Balneolaceae bacterium]
MSEKKIILQGSHLVKSFPSKTEEERLVVLNDLSIDIYQGDIACVIGASGSGKSTLLHILGGLDRPDSGTVSWNNRSMYEMNSEELADFRNKKLGFVFQFHHLLPEFTALENVMMPSLISGTSLKKAKERAMELLDRFGIAGRADHRPSELSGGEQQRVSMARALINNPDLILSDEPTGNLDQRNTDIILDMLFDLREIDNVSILLITHEKEIAQQTDIIYELSEGKLHPF